MEVAITKISSNGQIVISSEIRNALGIKAKDKFLVIGNEDGIILKRLKKETLKKELEGLLAEFSERLEEADVSKADVEKEIKKHRKAKRKAA